MYFEDQKKQGRNRSFAQVENFSNKNKVCQNPTQHQGQTKQIQSTSNKGTQDNQSYNQNHFHQDQPAFSVPSHPQYSSSVSQNMQINVKGQNLNHHSSMSLQNNQGVYKYSGSQNFQSSQLNNPQSFQQIQQNPSQSQKSQPQATDTQKILQEQHINTHQNKLQMQSSNCALSKAAQLKTSNSAQQSAQNMLGTNSINSQNCSNQFTKNSSYCQEINQHNNVKKSVQVNIKSKQKPENDQLDNSNIPQQQISLQQTVHSNLLPYAQNGEYALQQTNTSSSTNQQQLMNQQYATKTKKHQRHHSEIAISKHSKQYSILGVNLQPPPQMSIHNYQGFQKESYNKENLNIYDTAISSNRYNVNEQNLIQAKPKGISPHNTDSYKKLEYKNDQVTNQNQNQQGQQLYNEKNFNSSSLRFTANNPSCIMSINDGNTSSNNQKIEQGIQKEVINSYISLRLKNSRQNSISILPTHDQFKQNATEHNQIDDKNKNSSRQYKETKIGMISDENNSINYRQQNVESLKTKMSPIIQPQKQNDQKLAKLKDQDKYQNASLKVDQQDINSTLKGDNIMKNNKFQNYSILADEIQQNLNLQNRRVSALLNNDNTQNYLNLTENQSYQSTNRSLNNKHTSINTNYDQQPCNANIYSVPSNNSSVINKSNSTSFHQSNLQQGQQQKELVNTFTNINNGQGSQQNSTTNLSYNHSINNNQYQTSSNQTSIMHNSISQANPSFQTRANNKNDSQTNENNFQIQQNISLNSKIQNILSHETKSNLVSKNTTIQYNNPLNPNNQGQSLSSHPTYREKEFNIVQDYNPKSMIEKRRKSHSIANNIINSNSRNLKQAIIQSTLQQAQAQELSQNNSHLQSTNSMINQNLPQNSSQIISYNNQNFSQQTTTNKSNSNNPIKTQNGQQNLQTNMILQNVSQIGNNFGLAPSSQHTPTSISPINYMQSQSNYSSNSNLNNGCSSGSKQNICNQQPILNQANVSSGTQDQSKLSVNKVNLTFAEQLKIEKQKKLKEPTLNILNLGINSERNSKQNFVSNTANNSYSYCSNNSNNTSAISTPYAITNAVDTTQKSNIISNNTINSNNKANKNSYVNEPMIYSGKNSNSSSLQNTYVKNNNEFQQSYTKPYDNYTNPNSNRVNLPSNSIHTNQEPYSREMQQINELLQQAKYIAPSNTSNDSKYYTLQYNKLNNFESDFLLPTSAPAQQINSLAFKDLVNQKPNDIPQITRTNSIISNKKSSPSIIDQQNINQLKQTAKPCINNTKSGEYDLIQQSLTINKEQEYSSNSLKEKAQQPQLSGKQLILNNNISNNSSINQEKIFSTGEIIQQYDSSKNLSQNQINKIKNEQISQINIDKNFNEKPSQNDKKQQMQNVKSIQQQQQQCQQPVKWYLYDSQAQFEEQDNLNNFNSYGMQQKQQVAKTKDQIYQKQNKANVTETFPDNKHFLNSESSSLTQISTYREESSKCITNDSQFNNFNNHQGKQVNDIQYQEFNYQGQLQSTKQAKDFTIKETNMNQPYQLCQKTTNTNTKLENCSILNNINEIKDSYHMDFEDLAKYFSQNNGTKPSNNTPSSEKQKQIQSQLKLESEEYKNLCSSIESLRLLNTKDDPFIKIQNQEDFSEIQKLALKGSTTDDNFSNTNKNSIIYKNREKLQDDISEAIESDSSLNKIKSQQNHFIDEPYSINQQEFYSQSNLNLKQKNLNGFEGLYSIEEGEYELKSNPYYDQDSQNSSQFSLKAVEEELDDEEKSQRLKQSSQNNSQESINSNKQSDSQEKANISQQLKEKEEEESIEDPQLMCDEEQIYEMMNSNISNILDQINNDDPNQAFYSNNYYDQPCFNIESYSNFKIIPQSYSNAPSNQKQENETNYSSNPMVAPFVDVPQYDQKYHNSQNKNLSEIASKSHNIDPKENQKENQKKVESKQLEKDEKPVQEENQKKANKSISALGTNHQIQQKKTEENLSKEQKLALLKEQLANFDKIQNQFPIFGGEHLAYLLSRESDYQPNPFYMKHQRQFSPNMRAILLDWMMEVSEEFGLKRETYYIAVNLVDRMFSCKHNLQIKEFQLIGVTSLHIASKLEEIYPKRVEQFILSTDNGYTAQLVFETEKNILQKLNFMVNPPTVSFWGNWFMSQWDIFIQTSEKAQNSKLVLQFYENNSCFVQFRQATNQSYELFREYMQIMDFSILDVQTLQISATKLHCSIMYLVLGKAHGVYTLDDIQNEVAQGFIFTKKAQDFNDIYNEFASVSFGINIQNIVTCIQYISKFFVLPVTNALPFIISEMKEPLQGNYEDFLQYQTHNKNQIEKIKNIIQKVYKING
ncbi:amine-terminal domain cyclin (macronuclear) [Tetrahymena thermophila SB210]|uniref:Amine-terminal domain cyclin n=1 Tax=Tetrahymena thermophila (strain SB210) TaxID=312017 RepID=Q240T8_TETTS|nr:amine-terminal domain cyclin [Tetrahymena thermophila SB210]EAS02326.2 amine-terminal domain cyclin [Tetrahymena thermophila SB210]|eukprot:XP_001022571.2 amine-terminal domain cyclin [Tetrahymena thermophila SB210]